MHVITNVRKSTKSHLEALRHLIADNDEIVICSGWMKMCGLSELLADIDRALSRGATISVYTNHEHTETSCVSALAERSNLYHFNIPRPTYLHTKLYFGRRDDTYRVIIGSANITSGGLWKNEELSQGRTGRLDDEFHSQIAEYLERLPGLISSQ
ncbi:phospholipase D family protein [Pseudomonas aeruginosa]|uniref:phospholipase D family protein n=1 Tax=Pseudomonas aeruginosa TaxID=287 RepID=UPI0022B74673|nr:phospholipase D family protein [Pseudomonas aeruginosa]MCZ7719907.1 phospholipase D family protein [Pseudomonas aeruginosa]MCZ7823889.1 phospholipase D family protein [Pseudomonas aeruginosa]MDI3812009.1 phospholipase D family protein [Pseudomonas aeruginosa]MDI4056907.1 phospholipase D family protein [Pseudomonas aeruginosa]MDI4167042.1 phospholipase D family protein [Pseudomonas aeruginosa]